VAIISFMLSGDIRFDSREIRRGCGVGTDSALVMGWKKDITWTSVIVIITLRSNDFE